MKNRLIAVCVTLLAGSAWWTGCSSDSSSNGPGPVPDAGGQPDSAGSDDGGGGTDSSAVDAAKDTGVDTTLTGPYLPIMYGAANCPTFAACGGDVKGSWNVTGGCVTEALFDQARAACATLVESNVVIQARGIVVADALTIARHFEVKLSATLAVPAACKPAGFTCAQAGPLLTAGAGLKTAVCVDAGDGCTCDVTNELSEQTADAYTTSGNTLTTGAGGTARTFDYCVNASELKYKETTANNKIPAIFVNAK